MAADSTDNIYSDGPDSGLRLYRRLDERSGIARYEIEAEDPQSLEFEARRLDDYYRQYHMHMTRPHRHSFHQILWFRNPGSHFVDFREYCFERDAIFFIAKDHMHYFEDVVPEGMLVHLNTAYLGAALASKESAFVFHLFDSFYRSPLIVPDDRELAEMAALLKLILGEYEQPRSSAGNEVIMCLLSALLILGHRCKVAHEASEPGDDKRAPSVFLDFKWHLERDFAREHGVAHYASVLGLSPDHLAKACRAAAGVSAKQVISERVILEAKRVLCYSEMSVSEIAAHLGYADALYFSRVFKRRTGLSPSAFRASLSR